MNSTYSVGAARAKFPTMVRSAKAGRLVGVTKNNETVAFLISRDQLEAVIETKELLAKPAFVRAWKEEKASKGKYHPASVLAD